MSLSIKIPLSMILIIIALVTIGTFYYNLSDLYYHSVNQEVNNINLQIEKNSFRILTVGNLTKYFDKNNLKVADDIKDSGLLRKRRYYEYNGKDYSLIAMDYYGMNNERVKRELFKDGKVIHVYYFIFGPNPPLYLP